MQIDDFLKQLDTLFAEQKIDRVEPFLREVMANAHEEQDFNLYLSAGNELLGYLRSVSRFQDVYIVAEDLLLLMEELQMDDSAEFATLLLNTATAYSFDENFEQALNFYRRAEAIYKLHLEPTNELYAGLYNNMSSLYEKMGDNDQAIKLLSTCITILLKHDGKTMEIATAFTNLALLYMKIGDQESGKVCILKAIELFDSLDIPSAHRCGAYSAMAELAFHENDFEKAFEWYEKTMYELEKCYGTDNLSYAITAENAAAACDRIGDVQKAEELRKTAETIRSKVK